jgi:membrane-anchored protein YejM (alkaline phosphatase superfamily)
MMRSLGTPIDDLFPARDLPAGADGATRDLIDAMNQRHQVARPGDDALAARIRSYELAARMQLAVPEVADLRQETQATQSLYGLDRTESADFGRGCLLARRLLERGVRFVQLFSGGSFGNPRINWDGHENMRANHGQEAPRIDRPIAGLLRDLRRRGMLDDTLVLFTTEFGRTPFTQSAANVVGAGRDHNQYGFSVWLAGAGLKHGIEYGATDEIGWKAVEQIVNWHDFHATVLHLLGINHERLTYYHNGIRRRLTNVHGEILRDILA